MHGTLFALSKCTLHSCAILPCIVFNYDFNGPKTKLTVEMDRTKYHTVNWF